MAGAPAFMLMEGTQVILPPPPVEPPASLYLYKMVNSQYPVEGQQIIFTIRVLNPGDMIREGIQVTDILPTGITYVSASAEQGTYNSSTGVWAIGNIAASSYVDLLITATVDTGTAGTTIPNVAEITAIDVTDPDSSHHSGTATIDVQTVPAGGPSAPLILSKSVDNETPDEQEQTAFTIRVDNPGDAERTGIVVTDDLPTGLTLGMAIPGTGTYDAVTGEWTIGSLAAYGQAILVLVFTADAGTGGTSIENTATITATTETDVDTSRYADSASVTVNEFTAEVTGEYGLCAYGTDPYGMGLVTNKDASKSLKSMPYIVPDLAPGSNRLDAKMRPFVAEVTHSRNGVIVGSRFEVAKYRWTCIWNYLTQEDINNLLPFFLARKFYLLPFGSETSGKWTVRWTNRDFNPESIRGKYFNLKATLEEA